MPDSGHVPLKKNTAYNYCISWEWEILGLRVVHLALLFSCFCYLGPGVLEWGGWSNALQQHVAAAMWCPGRWRSLCWSGIGSCACMVGPGSRCGCST